MKEGLYEDNGVLIAPLSNILLKRNSKLDMIRSFKDSSYLDDDQKSRSQNWAKQFRPKGPLSYNVESKLTFWAVGTSKVTDKFRFRTIEDTKLKNRRKGTQRCTLLPKRIC